MESRLVEDIEILLWPNPLGLSAFATPFVFDLEYDAEKCATIDASYSRLIDYPSGLDRYRVLKGPDRAVILKAALARREDFIHLKGAFGGHLVKHREPGIDEAEFLQIVARFIQAWRASHL